MVYMSANSERVKRWRDKHRALHNLRRRNARKKDLPLGGKEAEVQTTVPRTEMMTVVGKAETLAKLRGMVKVEEEKQSTGVPASAETRSVKDVVGGIYRNDNGGVISKFAWEKLQKMKAHAKENNFEMDEYSQRRLRDLLPQANGSRDRGI